MRYQHLQVRTAVVFGAMILTALLLPSCYPKIPLATPTTENPENFPQPAPPLPPSLEAVEELPPTVTENKTFVTIDGVAQYRIGPGDLLDVFITRGSTQDRVQVPVRANGRIAVSFVEVPVEGLTADQAAAVISRALSVYLRNPVVDVLVKEYSSKRVSVIGAVGVTIRGGTGLIPLAGRTPLLEAIMKAGGFAPNASINKVSVTRASGKTYTVNMFRYVQEGDLSQEFTLDAGDIIYVPERGLGEERRVFLLGEVKNPGAIPLIPNMTLGQLVGQAGGWKDEARFHEARIIRGDLKSPEIISIDLGRLMMDGDRKIEQYLRPNDIVYIPRTPIANWNAFLATLRPTLEFISIPFQNIITIKGAQDVLK